MLISRRQYLKSSIAVVPAATIMPAVFSRAVAAAIHEQPFSAAPMGDRTLVIVQMKGGNDGLNTVVPANDPAYYEHRDLLAIPQNDILPMNNQVGFHPILNAFKELWDEGVLAAVEGVGYPQQNFSHFESMDIWQTGQYESIRSPEGWLGRYLEGIANEQAELKSLVVASKMPRALASRKVTVPMAQKPASFLLKADPRSKANLEARTQALIDIYASAKDISGFSALLDNTLDAAVKSSAAVQTAHEKYVPAVEYGDSKLAQSLRFVAEAVDADLGLRVGHVQIGGFDTHASQIPRQEALLKDTADSIAAFYKDLKAHGRDKNVVIMTWSEFGRRVKANASGGTDHGSAGPMFLVGTPVKGGLYGERASLTDIHKNNLKFTTDFRQVYSSVLENWLGAPAEIVLGARYEHIPFFNAGVDKP
ncbi:MAG: DUF1501 domain-containing protein [Gammaproteobacteria bacterium]|nr:DUF1501 domain-containing protein [Gammaproteobacteria bacterium]